MYAPDGTAISSSSAPDAMAYMLEASDLTRGLHVLEIGTGTGYNAALLASIVGSHGHVWTVDIDSDLVKTAARRLCDVAGSCVSVYAGNGLEGYASAAPYDRILATGSTSMVPFSWLEQVRPGGIILMRLIGEMGVRVSQARQTRSRAGGFWAFSFSLGIYGVVRSGDVSAQTCGTGWPVYRAECLHAAVMYTRGFRPFRAVETGFDFALQLAFPLMSFASAFVNPVCPCLIDLASDTMLLFRPTEAEQFQVEVRGDPHLWEQVLAVYDKWVAWGQPDVQAYHLHIDASGRQVVTLIPAPLQKQAHTWVIYEPELPDTSASFFEDESRM